MSLNLNHPKNTIESDFLDSIFRVKGGTPENPASLRIEASSLIVPKARIPYGERAMLIYDSQTNIMKYYNGIEWVSWASKSEIITEIDISLQEIRDKLDTKVDTVTYGQSPIPTASISGTTLNIMFPTTGAEEQEQSGLYTSLPQGSISYYSLTSGQNFTSIRVQLGGSSNAQNGRDGSREKPFISETGWCIADGMWWLWKGSNGDVVTQTPNLNQNNYLKSITATTNTNTTNIVQTSGNISSTEIKESNHYHGTGMMAHISDRSKADDGYFIFGKTFTGSYRGVQICGDKNVGRIEGNVSGADSRLALTTTEAIYPNGKPENAHTHDLTDLEVQHFKVAVLYNIAIPERALNSVDAGKLFVKKAGDVMTGSLDVANQLTIYGDSTLLNIPFKTKTTPREFGSIFADSRDNSISIRAGVNDTFKVAPGGKLTINGKALVQTINGAAPDVNGNVEVSGIPIGGVLIWMHNTIPENYIELTGRFDVTRWPKLAKLFPDGVVPDMRGVFPRGWDHGRGLDAGRGLRSYQDDAMQNHGHDAGVETTHPGDNNGTHRNVPGGFTEHNGRDLTGGFTEHNGRDLTGGIVNNGPGGIYGGVKVANETRPKNVSVMYIMRAN